MGLLDDAKKVVGQHEAQVNEGVDKVEGLVEEKTPDQYDAKVREGAGKAKDYLDKND